jgi:predicted RNA-binding Zn-ribbon protein involved in translation (DUF1610 family)
MKNTNQQPQFNVDLANTTEFTCSECGNDTFTAQFIVRKLSALLSPNGTESFIPINILACTKCGNVPEQFMPNLQ